MPSIWGFGVLPLSSICWVMDLKEKWRYSTRSAVWLCSIPLSSFNPGTSLRLSVVRLRLWSWCPWLKDGSLPRSSPMFWADGVTLLGAMASMQAVAGTWLASSVSLVSVSPSWKTRSPLYPGYDAKVSLWLGGFLDAFPWFCISWWLAYQLQSLSLDLRGKCVSAVFARRPHFLLP